MSLYDVFDIGHGPFSATANANNPFPTAKVLPSGTHDRGEVLSPRTVAGDKALALPHRRGVNGPCSGACGCV